MTLLITSFVSVGFILHSVLYLGIYLKFDNTTELTGRLHNERDDHYFPIVNLPFLSSNIPFSPAYCVFVFELVRYARDFGGYQDSFLIGQLLIWKLLSLGYTKPKFL